MVNSLQSKFKEAENIHFVCSGNIIRSSYAELYAKHLGIENTSSYGTTYHNTSIHSRSKQQLQDIGVDQQLIDQFKPTHIDDIESFSPTDLHVVMTAKHRKQLLHHGIPEQSIIKITEIIGKNHDVADPYFEGNYQEAYSTIARAVSQIDTFLT